MAASAGAGKRKPPPHFHGWPLVVDLDQARLPAMARFLASFMLLFGQAEACDVGFFLLPRMA